LVRCSEPRREVLMRAALSLIVACAACALPATSGAALTKTTVTFEDVTITGFAAGSVKSAKTRCKDDRRVTVYRKQGGVVGSDKADVGKGPGYHWVVEVGLETGRYYAKVKRGRGCAGNKSRVFEVG